MLHITSATRALAVVVGRIKVRQYRKTWLVPDTDNLAYSGPLGLNAVTKTIAGRFGQSE